MSSASVRSPRVLRLVPTLLVVWLWCLVGAVNVGLSLIPPVQWPEPIKVAITCLCGIALSLIVSEAARRTADARLRVAFPLVAASVLLGATTLWAIDVLVQNWTIGRPLSSDATAGAFLLRRYNWVYFAVLFSLQGSISALVASTQRLRAREQQLAEARLTALRLQINPHFLFNALNALSTLVAEAGAVEAQEMVLRLSDFFRFSLSTEPTELVSLESELEMVEAYLEIESVRFGERLRIDYACDRSLGDAEVTSLILQPLVENAVKYAVAPSREAVTIAITARVDAGDLVLTVVDDGHVDPVRSMPPGTGVGLRNVAARLDALYGAAGRLSAERIERGFAATIRMPFRRSSPAKAA